VHPISCCATSTLVNSRSMTSPTITSRALTAGRGRFGLAARRPRGRSAHRCTGTSEGSTSQLVQAMAGFGGGSGTGERTLSLSVPTHHSRRC
jgi:hypothetical protein